MCYSTIYLAIYKIFANFGASYGSAIINNSNTKYLNT